MVIAELAALAALVGEFDGNTFESHGNEDRSIGNRSMQLEEGSGAIAAPLLWTGFYSNFQSG